MRISSVSEIVKYNIKELWNAHIMLCKTLILSKMSVVNKNKMSVKVISINYFYNVDTKNNRIVLSNQENRTDLIKAKEFYDKMIFTTRKEAIGYIIKRNKYALENARWMLKNIPSVIINLKKMIKMEDEVEETWIRSLKSIWMRR